MSKSRVSNGQGIGIDFGTTNSLIAVHKVKSGKRTLFTDYRTHLPHPSVVWYRLEEPAKVGHDAKPQINGFAEVPGNAFVQSVKRHLGMCHVFDVFGGKKTATDVAADIFRHLLRDAQDNHRFEVKEAIVTIPIYFDGHARRELRRAAELAGLFIKTFVHEPFAALVGYLHEKNGDHGVLEADGKNILVFDWGGGTLDITVGRGESGQITELATAGIPDRAGDYFDSILGSIAQRKFEARHGLQADEINLDPRTKDRFNAECEQGKISLSQISEQPFRLSSFLREHSKTIDLSESITRQEFEEAIGPTVAKAMTEVDRALTMADISQRQVDLVLMVGGSSLIPIVQSEMRKKFGHAVINVDNASSLIAEGAAVVDALNLRPVFATSVGIELSDGNPIDIFKRGDLADPSFCKQAVNLFCTDNRDGLARLIVGLSNNQKKEFERKKIIAIPVSPDLPKPYNHERVTAHFFVDQDLVLNVDAKAATQANGVHEEIVDLRFALSSMEEAK
jgi:molecular chaperone DnaK